MLDFRSLCSVDHNCRYGATYAIVMIGGKAHTIFVGPDDESDWSGAWEVLIHTGNIRDGSLDHDPIGSVCAESETEARTIATALVRSDLSLLPFFDAIDTVLDRLSFAYGEDRISALFTVEPALAIAI